MSEAAHWHRQIIRNRQEHKKRYYIVGGEVIFGAKFCGYDTENGRIKAISYIKNGTESTIETDNVILP